MEDIPYKHLHDAIEKFFTNIKHDFEKTPLSLAIACSGGGDSLALLYLLKKWQEKHQDGLGQSVKITALIVDHGLRDESHAEALMVRDWVQQLHLPAVILQRDQAVSIQSNIQAQARQLRYALMARWCRENHVTYLLLGQHADDQAETFMLRLSRGSGPNGLACMQFLQPTENVILARPLLQIRKKELLAYLRAQNITWIEDPSNQLDKFDRVKFRKLLPSLQDAGLTVARLNKSAMIQRETQEALDWSWQAALKDSLKIYDAGCIKIDLPKLIHLPKALCMRVLSLAIKDVSGQPYGPDYDKLSNIFQLIHQNYDEKEGRFGCTAHGARLHCGNGKDLWIGKDPSVTIKQTSLSGEFEDKTGNKAISLKFEGRFMYHKPLPDGYKLAPLGYEGWALWAQKFKKNKKDCPYPAYIRDNIPAIFKVKEEGKWELQAPITNLFLDDPTEIQQITAEKLVSFCFSKEFRDFAFSISLIDTM